MTFQLSTSARKKLPKALEKRRISQIFLYRTFWSGLKPGGPRSQQHQLCQYLCRWSQSSMKFDAVLSKNQPRISIRNLAIAGWNTLLPVAGDLRRKALQRAQWCWGAQGIPSRRDATACHGMPRPPWCTNENRIWWFYNTHFQRCKIHMFLLYYHTNHSEIP